MCRRKQAISRLVFFDLQLNTQQDEETDNLESHSTCNASNLSDCYILHTQFQTVCNL
jgi:hypothetical protein